LKLERLRSVNSGRNADNYCGTWRAEWQVRRVTSRRQRGTHACSGSARSMTPHQSINQLISPSKSCHLNNGEQQFTK